MPDAEFQWEELSHISKSEASPKKPRMHMNCGRESTAMTLHSVQADPLSSRSGHMTTAFSPSASRQAAEAFAGRQSSFFAASPFQTDQTRPSLQASRVGPSSFRRHQHMAGSDVCIPEEQE